MLTCRTHFCALLVTGDVSAPERASLSLQLVAAWNPYRAALNMAAGFQRDAKKGRETGVSVVLQPMQRTGSGFLDDAFTLEPPQGTDRGKYLPPLLCR